MVISHNIGAMNAQRQYNIVANKKAKSTEKLSSGYRINRAADDAAGLSISEKMRRQVRGLARGVENTEDGVSLCQVADGALAEVHDMLQRINELSIQSANGTNSYSDRQAIQEEINQLLTEIDRIGETTSFNEQKIFKPQTVISSNKTNTTDTSFAISNVNCTGTPIDTTITQYTFDADATGLLVNGQSIAWADIKASNGETMDSLVANTYSTDVNGLTFSFTLEENSTIDKISESLKDVKVNITSEVGVAKEAVIGINAAGTSFKTDSTGKYELSKNEYFAIPGSYQLTADDTGITWNGQTITWGETNTISMNGSSYEESIINGVDLWLDFENGPTFQVCINDNASKEGVINALNGATLDIELSGSMVYSGAESFTNSQYTEFDFDMRHSLNDRFWTLAGYDVYDSYQFTQVATPTFYITDDLANLQVTLDTDSVLVAFSISDESRNRIREILNNGGNLSANEKLQLKFECGDSTVSYEVTPLQDRSLMDCLNSLKSFVESQASVDKAISGMDTKNFVYNDITQGNVGNVPISYNFDISQPKKQDDSQESKIGLDKKWNLWIQSGCDAGDGISLEIDRMNTEILNIKGLNVLTEQGVGETITAISEAIQKISASRGKIGAQQNRLEHTIANENNIVENTTAAESRIRDADMAELMVQFSKENILTQVGQSMMAQSNQSNQGVLSLLQ